MFVCVDVQYEAEHGAVTACLGFDDWDAASSRAEWVQRSTRPIADYEPGSFYKRELPLILEALQSSPYAIALVIVDGYVWLGPERPGLGAHLFAALGRRTPVVGVAKRSFRDAPALPVLRGASQRPLFVTAAGIDPMLAAQHVHAMHGAQRLPTLLRRVDHLARGHEQPKSTEASRERKRHM